MAAAAVKPQSDGGRRTRDQLIETTLDALAEVGFHGATLAEIASRAGVSPGLVAHHFVNKDGLLAAAFRELIARTGREVLAGLARARDPRARLEAIVDAHLGPEAFDQRIGAAWLAFWGNVPRDARLRRLQTIYQRRMIANLRDALRGLSPAEAVAPVAAMIASLIDGVWLRAALSGWSETDSERSRALIMRFIDSELARLGPPAAEPELTPRAAWDAAVVRLEAAQPGWARRGDRPAILRRAAEALRRDGADADAGDRAWPGIEAAADALDACARTAEQPDALEAPSAGFVRAVDAPLGVVLAAVEGPRAERDAARAAALALAHGNALLLAAPPAALPGVRRVVAGLAEAGVDPGAVEVLAGPPPKPLAGAHRIDPTWGLDAVLVLDTADLDLVASALQGARDLAAPVWAPRRLVPRLAARLDAETAERLRPFDSLQEAADSLGRALRVAAVFGADLAAAQRAGQALAAEAILLNPRGDLEAAVDAVWVEPRRLRSCVHRQRLVLAP